MTSVSAGHMWLHIPLHHCTHTELCCCPMWTKVDSLPLCLSLIEHLVEQQMHKLKLLPCQWKNRLVLYSWQWSATHMYICIEWYVCMCTHYSACTVLRLTLLGNSTHQYTSNVQCSFCHFTCCFLTYIRTYVCMCMSYHIHMFLYTCAFTVISTRTW